LHRTQRVARPAITTTTHRTPHTAHRTPHTAHRTPHTAHRTPHTAHRTGKLKEFKAYMAAEGAARPDVAALQGEVEALANSFPMPGL
jgi:glycine hydroxymethyltransferase